MVWIAGGEAHLFCRQVPDVGGVLLPGVLDVVGLQQLMSIEAGREDLVVALLDGPVALPHPDLSGAHVREISPAGSAACQRRESQACRHGTFVAGILGATRSSGALGVCPGCTLLVRPIFADYLESVPRATAEQLARAIVESLDAGARIINISAALSPMVGREPELEGALEFAARRGAIVIAAAGNDGTLGSSPLTRHPTVIPVTACDALGRPVPTSNLARSMGVRGIAAPGAVTSISPSGPLVRSSGTSFAAALVSGACALLWSAFRGAAAHEITRAVIGAGRRTSVSPPRLDAWAAYQHLLSLGVRTN
jgi:subtilisin family serine protease